MSDAAARYRRRWDRIEASFVDGPAAAVEAAAALVTELGGERGELDGRWNRPGASTEELRAALVHYRSIFDRLLERPATSVSGLDVDATDELLAGQEPADVLRHP